MLCSCTGGEHGNADGAVPLPEAYPRIDVYPAEYKSYDSLPVTVSVNRALTPVLKPGRTPGLDIPYPRYNATVYLTIIPDTFADFDQIWNARRARIDNNLGDIPTTALEIHSQSDSTFISALVVAKSATQTPVQLLAASRRHGIIVSATAFLHTKVSPTSLDSITSAIESLATDLRHLAENLAVPVTGK